MATPSGKKPARSVKDLRAKKLTGKQAKTIKGGGIKTYLPAVQMADGSVRPIARWDVKANKQS